LDEYDGAEQAREIERLKQQLDMLDNRLDNIDSVVTAVAERIMSQLVTLEITCPHWQGNRAINRRNQRLRR
jgi:uncharacterized coiled-coil protein SlyX